MQHFSEEYSAEVVKQQYANCKDIRLKNIMESAVTHLHEFVKEVEPTQEEWMYMIEYLTKTCQQCDDKRQEFILLSDVLGISALVDTINNRKTLNATESTVLGPFHVKNAPIKEMGDNINCDGKGEPAFIFGSVTDTDGNPIMVNWGDCYCSADIDDCGVCDGDNTSCEDCAGIPYGDNEIDNCGTCDDESCKLISTKRKYEILPRVMS